MPHSKCHASVEGHNEPMVALQGRELRETNLLCTGSGGRVGLEGPTHDQGRRIGD